MSSPVISVTRLKRSFKSGSEDIAVLKDISLTVNQGEFVAVMGASGSGKSTLLNVLGGAAASGFRHGDGGWAGPRLHV